MNQPKIDYPSDSDDSDNNSYDDQLFAKAHAKKQSSNLAKFDDSDTDTSSHNSSNVDSKIPLFLKGCNINIMDPVTVKENGKYGAYKLYEILITTASKERISVYR